MFSKTRTCCSFATLLLATSLVMLLALPANAINITPVFNAGSSDAVGFDPGAAGLIDLFDYAEFFYQDVFQDSHNITINFWYDNLSDTDRTLGSHSLVSQSGGRETEANIRIDTTFLGVERNWFIDGTPESNNEFNMMQTLWRDIPANQTDWYTFGASDVPETFEVGYTGNATSGNAIGNTDMLSIVLHEVGHALGMSASNTSTQTETADGDYDFNPNFVFGEALAVETANDCPPTNPTCDNNLNIAHLESPNALMTPSISSSLRRLPSHSDLFAMASGHSYTNIDAPRREFYGNSNWQNSGNWTGDTVPGGLDDVYVRDAQGSAVVLTARLNADSFAANLFISEGGNVDTNEFKLDLNFFNPGDAFVTGLDSDIFIDPGGELQADDVFIQDQAEIEMSGGVLDANDLTIDDGTQLQGVSAGAITVEIANFLINNGEVEAAGDSVMTFTSASATAWDLDGTSADGILRAANGDLIFDTGGLRDEFDGSIIVGAGHQLRIDAAWTERGDVDLNGGATATDLATIRGGAVTVSGGTISADGFSIIDAVAEYTGGVAVSLVDAATELRLGSSIGDTVTFNGTSAFSGPGTLVLNGDTTVNGTVDISVDNFDFDGDSLSDTTITSTGVMNITSNTINDSYSGFLTINGGIANVDTANQWSIGGTLTFSASGQLNGGALVNITGAVTTTGRGIINAPVDFEAAASVSVPNAGDVLELNNTTNYRGGSYVGGGRIQQDGDANVRANTTISVDVFDWDGSVGVGAQTTIFAGRTLTLNVNQIDLGVGGYDGTANVNSGRLIVNTPATWSLDGDLLLDNTGGGTPTLSGAPMRVTGTANATGGLADVNSAVVTSVGGNVNVVGLATWRQDGSFDHSGSLRIAAGSAMITNNFAGFAASSLNTIDGTLRLNSNTVFAGGQYTGIGRINQFGFAVVAETTKFEVDFQFRNGSITEIVAGRELQLSLSGTVEAGAQIFGPGRLHNLSSSTLTLKDNSVIDTVLINDGTVEVGNSPGISSVLDYVQTRGGSLDIELAGLVQVAEYDLLRVGNTAQLDGELDVSLLGLFSPALGNSFEIIRASSRLGMFNSLNLPVLGGGLGWDIFYGANQVVLEVIQLPTLACDFDSSGTCDIDDMDLLYGGIDVNDLTFDINSSGTTDNADIPEWLLQAGAENGKVYLPGDTDLDGDVLGDDFTTLAFNFGMSPRLWGEGNFDGNTGGVFIVAGSDFTQLAFNFGHTSLAAVASVPEPGMFPLACLALLGGLCWRRRGSRR